MWEQDHLKIWDAIRMLEVRLAGHEAACEVRNKEVGGRQEESIRDRHALNLKYDALLARYNADQLQAARNQNRLLLAAIGAGVSAVGSMAGVALTLIK